MAGSACTMERGLAVIGDRWALLILRDAFLGVNRFEEFQRRLGMARNVLAQRLACLVENDIFDRVPYRERPARFEYRLTAKGHGLYPVVFALADWSQAHFGQADVAPVSYRHRSCGHTIRPLLACPDCGGPLTAALVDVRGMGPAREPGHRHIGTAIL